MTENGFFDESVAQTYDEKHGGNDSEDVRKTVKLLSELAAGGNALEFAIGTGRVALPLRAKGVEVKGIELSKPMVQQLRLKETAAPMEVIIGDMSRARFKEEFSLVFLVFNTIDNLVTQDDQVRCFENAAAHLKPGGRFLVETLVPPIQRIPFGETKLAFAKDENHWGIDDFDLPRQTYSSNHIWMENDKIEKLTVPFRFAWPEEMDLMARIAGMKLENRWGDWDRSQFTNLSERHISVWRKV